MAGSIGDLIWQMSGKEDPRAALMAQAAGAAGMDTSGTPGPGGATSPDVGMAGATPTGAAASAVSTAPTPEALKSTPDMMELYSQIAEKDNFTHSINTGLGLILSSLAYDENKDSIEGAFGVGTQTGGSGSDTLGGGSPMSMIKDMMDLRTKSAALATAAANRAALPSIAKQYGIDLQTAQYLFDTGKLDSVISEAEKPNKQIVTDTNGQTRVVDLTDGSMGEALGPPKKREVEIIKDDNTGEQKVVWKDDKTPVAGREPLVKGERKTDVVEGQNGEKIAVDAITKVPLYGREPIVKGVRKTEYVDTPDGGKVLVFSDDKTPVGKGDMASIGSTEKSKLWHDDMVDRAKRGLPEIPLDDWLAQQAEKVKTDKDTFGDPPTDMAWKRDKDGKIEIDPTNNTPIPVPLPGTKLDRETKIAQNAAKGKDKMKNMTSNVVVDNIDQALKNIDDNSDSWLPTTGVGGLLADLPLPTDAGSLKDKLETIKANIGFDKLNDIRASNTTGGGLGPISDFENKLLQATFGNLRQTGQEKDIKYNLNRVKKLYTYLATRSDDAPITSEAEAEAIMGAPAPEDDPDVEALVGKYAPKGK